MIENKILLSTPSNPGDLLGIFDEKREDISKITIFSVDFSPLEISCYAQGIKSENVLSKKQNSEAVFYEVAGMIIDISLKDYQSSDINKLKSIAKQSKKVFVVANEVMYLKQNDKKMVLINGGFTIVPEELISKIYTNYPDLKSANLEELDDLLNLSKDETAIKAFKKLDNYFTASHYQETNNIFNLIEHQNQANAISKKVLLKKMVAWEIRK